MEFNFWKKGIERILAIYEVLRDILKCYGILSAIKNKITGNPYKALESYNMPVNWVAAPQSRFTHTGDRRDLAILEYQVTTLVQVNQSIPDYCQKIVAA